MIQYIKTIAAFCEEFMAGFFVSDKKRQDGKIFILLLIWISVEVCLASHPGVAPNLHLLAASLISWQQIYIL